MSLSALPHTPYVAAVIEALAAAGMPCTEWWAEDADSRGTWCHLSAVVTLDPSKTHDLDDIPKGTTWPYGLALIWEWHTGREEDGDPERGPVWCFAAFKGDGNNEYPTALPVAGFADPAAVVAAARLVIDRSIKPGHHHNSGEAEWDGGEIGGTWEQAAQLEADCAAWEAVHA